jgi:hypothetical protein
MNVAKPSFAQRESSRRGAPKLWDGLFAPQPALRADLSHQRKREVSGTINMSLP